MDHFEQVKGYKELKSELENVLDIIVNPDKYRKLGVTTPKGLLLHGEPGVGKTLMANCFIAASGRKSFVCRKNKPNGDFVKYIKATFDKAKENQPSIVFLDDMDKFANEDSYHKNAEEFVTIQSCIDDVKKNEVFVIATTNDTRSLPDSLLRAGRFDQTICVEAPRGKDAEEIVEYYMEKKKHVAEIDTVFIAKLLDGRSCAELETIINEAGIYAGFNGKDMIGMDDIINACMRVLFVAPDCNDVDEKEIEKIAYHEAGHTVIAEIFEPGSINLVSVRPNKGKIGGITSYDQNKNYFRSKRFMEYRVISLLGGKAATEIKYGDVDVGTNSDIRRAFDIVSRFVDDYCSTGFDRYIINAEASKDLLARKELQTSFEIEKYYAIARKILILNREFLDKTASALMKKHTIIQSDVAAIKKECPIITTGFGF